MRDDIAFLHTAQVHVPAFERLVRAQAPASCVRHAVDEALLADARIVGTGDAAQASMAPVEQALADLGIEVLSSPAPGVAHVLSVAQSRYELSIHKATQIL